jgi:hypothetical protein
MGWLPAAKYRERRFAKWMAQSELELLAGIKGAT